MPPPNADRPNDGQVKFGVEVGPMGCMGYEVVAPVSNYGIGDAVDGGQVGSGGGGGDVPYVQRLKSNRILRLLERTLLIGGSIDAEALCVQSGVWVWRLHVDVSLLDDGGNSMDACVLAAVAALRHYRLPEVDIGGGDGNDDGDDNANNIGYQETTIIHSDDREPTPLPLHHTPLTATFALFSDETGTTTSVSALLDPFDREELASDGLLTWSYNKYGEMCCLDFPGGCELRPRQLMASSNLGKRRCIEICELLETALAEAETKAETERMARLKKMNEWRPVNVVPDDTTMEDSNENVAMDDHDDADARNEEEKYRKIALDYASGHFAASVKEDKEKKQISQGKNSRGETSSLFHAILRSAQSTDMGQVHDDTMTEQADMTKKDVVEIIAHEQFDITKEQSKKKRVSSMPTPATAPVDSDEEEVVQLQSEFTANEKETSADEPEVAKETNALVEKETKSKAASKPNAMAVDEGDVIDDLAMAMKKKSKKSKKSSKKK